MSTYPTRIPGIVARKDELGHEIRMFADSGLQESIDRFARGIKDGRRGFVMPYIDRDAVRLAVVVKPFGWDDFTVVGTLAHEWGGSLDDLGVSLAGKFDF